jgi:hypothetical protein
MENKIHQSNDFKFSFVMVFNNRNHLTNNGPEVFPCKTYVEAMNYISMVTDSVEKCYILDNTTDKAILVIKSNNMKLPPHSKNDWVEDFIFENGYYQNICIKCNNTFMGHKRRIICKTCSE